MNALSIEHTTAWRTLGQRHGPALAESDITPLYFMQEVELAPTYVLVKGGIEPTPKLGAIVRKDGQVVGEGLGRGTYGVVQPSEVYQFGREIEALSDWPLVACGEMFVAAVAFYEAWAAPVRRSASDDDATEHETRAVRQFDALVRTNRQQLTRQALSLFV